MATLKEQIENVIISIRTKFNSIAPKLVPTGGTTGQVLTKLSNTDNNVTWTNPPTNNPADESFIIAMSIIYGDK